VEDRPLLESLPVGDRCKCDRVPGEMEGVATTGGDVDDPPHPMITVKVIGCGQHASQ
jgi:hypothetical protein